MWFHQTEAVFRRACISKQQTMYDYVLEKLPEDVVTSVRDIIQPIYLHPEDAYDRLYIIIKINNNHIIIAIIVTYYCHMAFLYIQNSTCECA